MKIIVGITGASGAIYGWRLLQILSGQGHEIHAVVSEQGWQVLKHECGVGQADLQTVVTYLYDIREMSAPIASGSFRTDAMVIVPCSMRTLGAVANGLSDNLICRSADVTLKEGRRLVIVPRETPLNAIHLNNMLTIARAGAIVAPAAPGFYHQPSDLMSLVDMMIGKICDLICVDHNLFKRWQG
ncbi:MAG: UbiX family flavin prenyltransferase [Negativicutes bacterium]|nr:UbiX family flavin prenyltransferase [Negativicutes bacterium]